MKTPLVAGYLFAAQAVWPQQQHKPVTEASPQGQLTVTQTVAFDTVAAYAEGKILNRQTHLPVAEAKVSIVYNGGRAVATANSAKDGQFRVGWVSTGRDRSVRIEARGFQILEKRETRIRDGHSNFLLVELVPVAR